MRRVYVPIGIAGLGFDWNSDSQTYSFREPNSLSEDVKKLLYIYLATQGPMFITDELLAGANWDGEIYIWRDAQRAAYVVEARLKDPDE